MSDDVVLRVENLWKRYGLPLGASLRGAYSHLRRREFDETNFGKWSLKDVSFELKRGETLGIIGRNGAGKSTLLKVLAGVSPPTKGRVEMRGRIFPMIELNAGMHMELTGRENVHLLGTVMGMSRAEVKAKLPAIEEFCDLGTWFERPVWQYSSGMLARLGFAVALNVDADILLVDEVLAVGDITFQRKSLDQMERMQEAGKTVLFVSHAIRQVERLCDRALLLEEGRMIVMDKTAEVITRYYEAANTKIMQQYSVDGEQVSIIRHAMEDALIEIEDIRLLDESGTARNTFYTGDSLTIEVRYNAHEAVENPAIGFAIATVDTFYITGFTTDALSRPIPLKGRGVFRCTIPSLKLLNGIYTLDLKIRHPNSSIMGGGRSLAVFTVVVPTEARLASDYGVVQMDAVWQDGETVISPLIPVKG